MNILIIGAGFCGQAIGAACRVRFPEAMMGMTARAGVLKAGFDYLVDFKADFDFSAITHLVVTAPPAPFDPFLTRFGDQAFPSLQHILYLSTTAVYGDQGGAWVDEKTLVNPCSDRAKRRVAAETAWIERGVSTCLFRLSGLYGDHRNALKDVLDGSARRLHKEGQVFNRIHHDDVGRAGAALMDLRYDGCVNGADDEPAPSHEVTAFAASLLNIAPPSLIAFEEAHLSLMALSFWAENKRISNRLLKELTGEMLYPTYREGLCALQKRL